MKVNKNFFTVCFLLIAIFLSVFVSLYLKTGIVYTHIYYLIIILIAFWFYRLVIPAAIFLGFLHIALEYICNDGFYAASLLRAVILIIVGVFLFNIRQNQHKNARQLEAEHENTENLIKSIGDGVIAVDSQKRIIRLNNIGEILTGWSEREALGRAFGEVFDLSHESKEYAVANPVDEVIRTGTNYELSNHAVLTSRDGVRRHIEDSAAPIRDNKGNTDGVVLIFRDVTEKKEIRKQLQHMSFHDYLTGLYNRRFFEEELTRLDTYRNYPLTIIMADVDGLKITNDTFGHLAGDRLLIKASEIMKSHCRQDDIIARWGGDEFIILLPSTSEKQAAEIVNRIESAIAGTKMQDGILSVSFGWDTKHDEAQDIYITFKNAEDAMYQQKLQKKKLLGKHYF